MLPFSSSVSYAFRALAVMDGPEGTLLVREELARLSGAPGPFLGKVLQSLQKAGILDSMRGRHGGFRLTRDSAEVTLADVVDALHGTEWRVVCLLGLEGCAGRPSCPARGCCVDVRDRMNGELSRLTVRDLARMLAGGKDLGLVPPSP